jgi:hypothetical protein
MQNGELSPRTFADAHRTCGNLLDYFGKHRRILEKTARLYKANQLTDASP